MSPAAAAEFIPLEADSQGVLRVARTNVTLDTVVERYRAGHTAEEIARQYPALQLADVYAVLAYYLRYPMEVEAYIRRHPKESAPGAPRISNPVERILPALEPVPPPAGFDRIGGLANERSELLARKHRGEELSSDEQARLRTLTASLQKALPPISSQELQALLEMTNEVSLIRERARERRHRLELG